MEKNKNIPTLILYIFLTVVLSLSLPLSGFFIPLIIILTSALLVATALNHNLIFSAVSSVLSGLALFLLFRSVTLAIAVPAVLLISATGIYLALKFKTSLKAVVLAGTSGSFLLIIVLAALLGSDFITQLVNAAKLLYMDSLEGIMMSMPTDFGSADIRQLKQVYEELFEGIKVIAPSILLSSIFLLSYFSITVSKHFAKGNPWFDGISAFSEIHARPVFLLITAISYFGQTWENAFLSGLMANLFMIMTVYYTLCGFSLFDFVLKRRIKALFGRIGIILAAVIVLTVISMFLLFANPILIAMFFGVADSFFNYRLRATLPTNKA